MQRMTSDDRRAAIMETAIKLFSERGFRGTTTRALADALGVSEPVLYEHFKSKRELFEAIIEVKSREGVARATAMLQPLDDAGDEGDIPIQVVLGLGKLRVDQVAVEIADGWHTFLVHPESVSCTPKTPEKSSPAIPTRFTR